MQELIFDTHAHYSSDAFDGERGDILAALPLQGVGLIVDCGTDYTSSIKSIELANKYNYIYAAAGIHPESIISESASTLEVFGGDWREEMKAMQKLYDDEKVVAVGEVGLDHHWPIAHDVQLELFESEMRFALERDLPLIIHDRQAHAEVYALLKKYKPKGVLHAYSGSAEDVKWLCAQGIYIGFTGVVTFKNAHRPLTAAAAVPSEYLVLETDCPYMAPEPMRGKKSNSSMIKYTAARIAEARGVETERLLAQTMENGKRLFGIIDS